MPIFALIAIAAAAIQGGSAPVYGPPAPSMPSAPVIHALPDDGINNGININRTVQQVLSDIDRGRDSGQLSRRQAKQLRADLDEIGRLEQRYAQDGLSDAERTELRNRAEVVRAIANAKRLGAIK